LTFVDVEEGEAVCRALYKGGIKVLEISLCTSIALKVLELVKQIADDLVVGVGTLTRPEQCEAAKKAGAQFSVSPGFSKALGKGVRDAQLPWLPGVMTPSDILLALDDGYETVKFFPAQAGSMSLLNAFYSLFPTVQFCPSGCISEETA